VTLLVLGLTLSGLGIADYAGSPIPPLVYAAATLLVLGLALIAATWFGRARGLLPLGVGVLVAVLAMSMSNPAATGLPTPPGSTVSRSYTTVSQLPAGGDVLEVGRLEVDLSRLAVTSDTTYSARMDAGELEVIVPADVNVVIDYQVDLGSVTAYGSQRAGGTELTGVIPDPVTGPTDEPQLTVRLAVSVGQVTVQR
jgi:hypothetical protein